MPATKTAKKAEGDLLYIFTYLLTILSGLIVYFTVAQKNTRIKFHAVQAIFLGIGMILVSAIIGWIFSPLAGLINFLLWLYGLYVGYQAYQGNDMEMPVIGGLAKQYSK